MEIQSYPVEAGFLPTHPLGGKISLAHVCTFISILLIYKFVCSLVLLLSSCNITQGPLLILK